MEILFSIILWALGLILGAMALFIGFCVILGAAGIIGHGGDKIVNTLIRQKKYTIPVLILFFVWVVFLQLSGYLNSAS